MLLSLCCEQRPEKNLYSCDQLSSASYSLKLGHETRLAVVMSDVLTTAGNGIMTGNDICCVGSVMSSACALY